MTCTLTMSPRVRLSYRKYPLISPISCPLNEIRRSVICETAERAVIVDVYSIIKLVHVGFSGVGIMADQKTHREVKQPQISVRYLADYMASSEQVRRTIVRGCKYQPIARLVQHDEAKQAVAKFIRSNMSDVVSLQAGAQRLRGRMANSDFDRDVLDHNADYIDRSAIVGPKLELPKAEILPAGRNVPVVLQGTKVTPEIQFRLRRVTRTNKVRVGVPALRYAKGKGLSPAVGEWQSALLFGLLSLPGMADGDEPELKLCLTVDAYEGVCYPAPTNAISCFNNAEAACATIAERWPNVSPPPGAII